ncbi:MAG: hypothetical protein EP330_01120 [Deltaproteobacteria bacterium]|nr:MAG: hypothetical protein EP330_01120 [Deltaproteobacteria bacterium]
MILTLITAALASPPTPVTLTGQLGAAAGPPSLGGSASGDLAVNFGRAAVSVGAREGYMTEASRSLGSVEVQGRYYASDLFYVQGGFYHFHETPADVLAEYPVLATIGSAPGIIHRSGLGGGIGLDYTLDDVVDGRLGAVAELTAAVFPDAGGPTVYVIADFGFSVDVGKRRE